TPRPLARNPGADRSSWTDHRATAPLLGTSTEAQLGQSASVGRFFSMTNQERQADPQITNSTRRGSWLGRKTPDVDARHTFREERGSVWRIRCLPPGDTPFRLIFRYRRPDGARRFTTPLLYRL